MNWKRLLPRRVQAVLDIPRYMLDGFVARVAEEVPPGAAVLDAGAGDGRYRAYFGRQRYVALDFAQGSSTTDYRALDLVADLLALPVAPACFDAVLCTNALEHVRDPAQCLRELHRVLRPGGLVYLAAPQAAREHQVPYDYFRFTSYGLRYLLSATGFDLVTLEAEGGYFRFVGWNLTRMTGYLLPRRRPWPVKIITLPLEPLAKIFFTIVVPLVCTALDRLDRKRAYTLGYLITAKKGAG